ncbi:MAG TPA: hypothetical protein VF306_07700 [Pirellulales bacterium]
MASATTTAFQPVGRMEHLERLAILAESPAAAAALWDDVHESVQSDLALLEAEVRRTIPGVRVDIGRTHGGRFYLFSYRTFSLPDGHVDPVVAGVTFAPAPDGVTVEADVNGEQTGDWIAAVPCKTVVTSRDALLHAAHDSARRLCGFADAVAAALRDPSRNVN